jgi:hypothetical protein
MITEAVSNLEPRAMPNCLGFADINFNLTSTQNNFYNIHHSALPLLLRINLLGKLI